MNWKGNELKTAGDLMDKGIDRCDTPEEAQEFMKLYRAENEFADKNIGYLSGYYSPDKMAEIQKWFGVEHPIFGGAIPTPIEAFKMGKKIGKKQKKAAQ